MYNEKVMEIFKNPMNAGAIEGANAIGEVGGIECGDIMKIYLKIDENEVIVDAGFETFGCAAAITSSSIATEMLKGKTVEQALAMKNSDFVEALGGLPPQKIHCSVLAEEAIKEAIDYYKNQKESL